MNPWSGLRGLPKQMWILFTATLINRAGTMALPFLVLYLTERLAFSSGTAGLVIAAYGVGSLITAPFAGKLSDRAGPLAVMRASLIVSGVILFAYPLARSFTAILIITIIWAIMSEAFRPASMAVIADLVAPDQRKAAFALSRLAINLGMSVGPAAGGFLAMTSFSALFVVDGVTSIIAGVVLIVSPWKVYHHAAQIYSTEKPAVEKRTKSALTDRRFLYFLLAFIPVEMAFFQPQAAMPLFVVNGLGLTEAMFGILLTINTVLIIFLEVPLNTAMAHWNDRVALPVGAILTSIGFGALAYATGAWFIAVTVVFWTFGEMILFPASSAYVAEIAPANRRGEYMGYFQMTFSLSFAVGPALGAKVLEQAGATTLWIGTAVFCLLSAAMMMRIAPARLPESENQKSASSP